VAAEGVGVRVGTGVFSGVAVAGGTAVFSAAGVAVTGCVAVGVVVATAAVGDETGTSVGKSACEGGGWQLIRQKKAERNKKEENFFMECMGSGFPPAGLR
jgi:hypothetical protein